MGLLLVLLWDFFTEFWSIKKFHFKKIFAEKRTWQNLDEIYLTDSTRPCSVAYKYALARTQACAPQFSVGKLLNRAYNPDRCRKPIPVYGIRIFATNELETPKFDTRCIFGCSFWSRWENRAIFFTFWDNTFFKLPDFPVYLFSDFFTVYFYLNYIWQVPIQKTVP